MNGNHKLEPKSGEKQFEKVRQSLLPSNQTITRIFVYLITMTTIFLAEPILSLKAEPAKEGEAHKLAEEYTQKEKTKYVKELLELGDQQFDQKNYDQALAAYEQVFSMDPENKKASAKLDILKKQMMKEGKDETGVVKEIYDEEAKERIRGYWADVQAYLKNKKYGQARFTLEKILLLDPFNQEASSLYEKLKAKPGEAAAGSYEKRKAL